MRSTIFELEKVKKWVAKIPQKSVLKFIYSEKATKFCKIFILLLTTVQLRDPKNDFIFNFNFDNKMKNLWTVWISRKIWYLLKNFKAVLVVSCSLWAEHILSWATLTYQGPAEICWAQWIKTKIIFCRPLCCWV